ncbi:protein LOL1 [Sesamum angolense]|uniref:Protein LOL1 n=1 Tax=Sesamum angolense TaxID=2727404 RepID=A0AAE1W455_9LAMI|nr:protein LOL1 [Sesamum angolense]
MQNIHPTSTTLICAEDKGPSRFFSLFRDRECADGELPSARSVALAEVESVISMYGYSAILCERCYLWKYSPQLATTARRKQRAFLYLGPNGQSGSMAIWMMSYAFGMYMQSQLVCNGCRTILLYPCGATNVCCAVCNTVTAVPQAGMEMAQLICGGCRTLLMHARGATSVRCSCCHTVNLVPAAAPPNNVAHVNCGNCHTMLMYPAGAPSVKCAICHFITTVNAASPAHNQTVVVQNPMTVDESGKLVSNVVVGVTT